MKKSINFIILKAGIFLFLTIFVFTIINWNLYKQEEVFVQYYEDSERITKEKYISMYDQKQFMSLPGQGVFVEMTIEGEKFYKRAWFPYAHKTISKKAHTYKFKKVK